MSKETRRKRGSVVKSPTGKGFRAITKAGSWSHWPTKKAASNALKSLRTKPKKS